MSSKANMVDCHPEQALAASRGIWARRFVATALSQDEGAHERRASILELPASEEDHRRFSP